MLDFNMVARRHTIDARSASTELSNKASLAVLQNIERPPPHLWDEDERELLTIMYRWYQGGEVTMIPRVFNAITGLELRYRIVRSQFESHIKYFGGRAYPEYGRVMAIAFDDPNGRYDEIRSIVEDTAKQLGVELRRREVEVDFVSGLAQFAKSLTTRRAYKSLVRRAALTQKEKAIQISGLAEVPMLMPMPTTRLGGFPATSTWEPTDLEVFEDAEDTRMPLVALSKPRHRPLPTVDRIGFRVWDKNSRTKYSEDTGFVSQAFSIWRNDFPPPFSPDGQGRQALILLTNLHLSMSGGTSAFVSVSASLLQAMVKALAMENPRIAVVALDHPLLTEPNKTLHAAEVLLMLKKENQAWWARYKGHAERMVWASVPKPSILSDFPLSDLQVLSDKDTACANILALDQFQPRRKTQYVSSLLRERNITLSTETAQALAAIARAFGMHREDVSLEHLQALVASLVNSFHITKDSLLNVHTTSSIANAFSIALRSRVHGHQDVTAAFQNGVQQGTDINAYYNARRSAPRRTRTG
ncbi:hypothetical protein BDW02DRAFT_410809 [Decorospora gaudefroyi]|uniref:DUF7587 domain-containing protein n=1 Tax=Decorospora gaudefroyi TaxID=184978 RepID=A0A6A5KBV1_9PLEO|nr:hypothetical protein BDW02DRAFT_410809 [Decorospora gaudefroyi]